MTEGIEGFSDQFWAQVPDISKGVSVTHSVSLKKGVRVFRLFFQPTCPTNYRQHSTKFEINRTRNSTTILQLQKLLNVI